MRQSLRAVEPQIILRVIRYCPMKQYLMFFLSIFLLSCGPSSQTLAMFDLDENNTQLSVLSNPEEDIHTIKISVVGGADYDVDIYSHNDFWTSSDFFEIHRVDEVIYLLIRSSYASSDTNHIIRIERNRITLEKTIYGDVERIKNYYVVKDTTPGGYFQFTAFNLDFYQIQADEITLSKTTPEDTLLEYTSDIEEFFFHFLYIFQNKSDILTKSFIDSYSEELQTTMSFNEAVEIFSMIDLESPEVVPFQDSKWLYYYILGFEP
jgi:hypothetical protein